MRRHLKLLLVAHLFLIGSMASVIMDLCQEDNEAPLEETPVMTADLSNPKELQEMRYDLIRSQILHKLKLERPPCVKPMSHSDTEQFRTAFEMLESKSEIKEDELAKNRSDSFLVFPNNFDFTCHANNSTICSRFEFLLPPQTEFLTSVDLWLYRVSTFGYLQVWEPISEDMDYDTLDDYELFGNERLLSQETTVRPVYQWTRMELPLNLTLNRMGEQIALVLEVSGAMVAEMGTERPFLAVTSERLPTSSRKRRSVDCNDHIGSGCCREKFTINFKEIGYESWILWPFSYEANYCRGKCIHYLSSSTKRYHSVLFEHLASNASAAEKLGFKLCCTPSKMKPLSILWRDDNETIHHHSLPEMIVESCDCA